METRDKESEVETRLRLLDAELEQLKARRKGGVNTTRLLVRAFGVAVIVGALLAALFMMQWLLDAMEGLPRPAADSPAAPPPAGAPR